jgi:hypothetical protein
MPRYLCGSCQEQRDCFRECVLGVWELQGVDILVRCDLNSVISSHSRKNKKKPQILPSLASNSVAIPCTAANSSSEGMSTIRRYKTSCNIISRVSSQCANTTLTFFMTFCTRPNGPALPGPWLPRNPPSPRCILLSVSVWAPPRKAALPKPRLNAARSPIRPSPARPPRLLSMSFRCGI